MNEQAKMQRIADVCHKLANESLETSRSCKDQLEALSHYGSYEYYNARAGGLETAIRILKDESYV